MKRALGHLRGEQRKDDRPLMGLVRVGASARPSAISYAGLIDRIREQEQSSSCEGQAHALALYLRAKILNAPIPFPSALAIYGLAREIDQGTSVHLVDGGTYARSVHAAIAQAGVVAETRWPFSMANVAKSIPWDVVQAGGDDKVDIGDQYWIRTTGAQRCDDMRTALAAGYPLTLGLEVDDHFEDGTWDVYAGPTGELRGGHCLPVVAFRPGAFCVCNSWGSSWGQGGLGWISDSVIGDVALVNDVCAIAIAPAGAE